MTLTYNRAYAQGVVIDTAAIERPFPPNVTVRSPIGIAKAEARLTRVALSKPYELVRPGRGYGLIVLDEVELGVGRPDVVILSLSGAALRAWIDRGLRLQNWTEARVLAGTIDPRERVSAAVGYEHVRAIQRRLRFRGWDGRALRPAVREAYLLEAKVTDWRTGLVQLTHRQLLFSHAALLLPESVAPRVPRPLLRWHGLGLAVVDDDGEVRWSRRPVARRLSLAAQLWLTELAVEHFDSGHGYGARSSLARSSLSATE